MWDEGEAKFPGHLRETHKKGGQNWIENIKEAEGTAGGLLMRKDGYPYDDDEGAAEYRERHLFPQEEDRHQGAEHRGASSNGVGNGHPQGIDALYGQQPGQAGLKKANPQKDEDGRGCQVAERSEQK